MRLTIADVRMSRLPRTIGLCSGNTPEICAAVNEAQQRLINAGGETGWYGGWVRVVFNVSVSDPYITLDRTLARIINLDVCRVPVNINNEFYEVLPGGPGLLPDANCLDWCGNIAGYERGAVPTVFDLVGTQLLRAYISDARDVGSKLLITGLDANGLQIYTDVGVDSVNGFTLVFAQPFVTSGFTVSKIQAVQKDITYGDVVLKAVDAVTGVETTLARYAPTEINPAYRRYIIKQLPAACCGQVGTNTARVTALAKLEYIPAYLDTDQLIIGNIPALIEECMSIWYGEKDNESAQKMAVLHHNRAVRLLNDELRHYLGEQRPAVSVDIYQGAPLCRQGIGTLI